MSFHAPLPLQTSPASSDKGDMSSTRLWQRCSGCRRARPDEDFEGHRTCTPCRKRGRLPRVPTREASTSTADLEVSPGVSRLRRSILPVPESTVALLRQTVETLDIAAPDPAEGFTIENDRSTEDLDLDGAHHDIHQVLWHHFCEACPPLLRCHVRKSCAKRAFINVIQSGMPLHCDGGRPSGRGYDECMALVIHFSNNRDDTTPAVVKIDTLNYEFEIRPCFMYCFPGSYLRHGTDYTPVAGVKRYSCVLHLAMVKSVQTPGGQLPINDLLHEYYMLV